MSKKAVVKDKNIIITHMLFVCFKKNEKLCIAKKISEEEEILIPQYIECVSWMLFIVKVILILIGFLIIFTRLFGILEIG